jgi:tripartite ATP-independent transporter DctM subunit
VCSSDLFNLLPVVALLVAVLGSILLGVCSPTEASALGVAGASLIALAYRNFNIKMLGEALYETLKVTSMVFFVIMGAAMFTSVFMFMRGGNLIRDIILGLGFSRGWIMFIMMFMLFILGMFLDWIGILYITLPIFTPIAVSLGFNPLFFVLLVAVNLQLSFLSPPFAYAIFFVKGVCPPEVTTKDIYKGVVPFLCVQAIGLTLCCFFPQILMWLPSRF